MPSADRRRRAATRDDRRRSPSGSPSAGEEPEQAERREPERGRERTTAGRAIPSAGADRERDERRSTISRASLSFVPNRRHDEVLGAGRLVVDDEPGRSPRRARWRPAAAPAMSSETPRRGERPRRRRRPRRAGARPRARRAGRPADGRVEVVVLTASSCIGCVTFACRGAGRSAGRVASGAVQRPSCRSTSSGSPNASPSTSSRRTSRRSAPAATRAPSRSTRAWPNPRGISSRWCETRTIPRGRSPAASRLEVGEQHLAGREVEAGRRLVEDQHVRIGHERPGDRGPPPLAGRQRPERAGRGGRPRPMLAERSRRAFAVGVVVHVPPRLEGAVAGGHDQRRRREVRAHRAPRWRCRRTRPAAAARAHRSGRSARRGRRPCPSSATGSSRRPTAASSCHSRSARGRPSARRRGPTSRSDPGWSGRRDGR